MNDVLAVLVRRAKADAYFVKAHDNRVWILGVGYFGSPDVKVNALA